MSALLAVDDLHVSYGKVEAVSGVNLQMRAGEIVTVIGPNGAGKTTLLAALMGLQPAKGQIRYEGSDLSGLLTEERVRRGVCLVPERRELFTEMTVEDNLILGAYTRWRDRAEPAASEQQPKKLDAVRAKDRHAVARSDAGGVQRAGGTRRSRGRIRVGPGVVARAHQRLVAVPFRLAHQHRRQRALRRRKCLRQSVP